MIIYCLVFFFKQKTAYEMRISDWSSDVCSSDLTEIGVRQGRFQDVERIQGIRDARQRARSGDRGDHRRRVRDDHQVADRRCHHARGRLAVRWVRLFELLHPPRAAPRKLRSEEHTSELKSLMRISYAVFCLKKIHH